MFNLDRLMSYQEEMLDRALYGRVDLVCPVCGEHHHEDDSRWIIPHECARSMKDIDLVCSNTCALEWREDNWEYIEEFEIDQQEEFYKEFEV